MVLIPKNFQLVNVEARVLAFLVRNPACVKEYNLQPDSYFYENLHREVYHALYSVSSSICTEDIILSRINPDLHVQASKFLTNAAAPTKEQFIADLHLLKENSYLVDIWCLNENLNLSLPNLSKDDCLAKVKEWKERLDLLEKHSIILAEDNFEKADKIVESVINDVAERTLHGSNMLGYPTGLHSLDQLTLGLVPTNLVVVGGRPGAGKTAFLGSIIKNHVLRKDSRPFLFFSLEMSKLEVGYRLLSSLARVKIRKLRAASLSKQEWLRIVWAKMLLDSVNNFEIDETAGVSLEYIEDKCAQRKDAAVISLDYLQLVSAKAETRAREVAKVCASLKQIAKRQNVPFIALSQINRNAEASDSNKRPNLKDLKDGGVEDHADLALLLYRDKYYRPDTPFGDLAEVIVAKARSGAVGTVFSLFMDEFTSFESVEVVK